MNDASGSNGSPQLFASSPAMTQVKHLTQLASSTRCGVLIKGEAGTGRETVARAIHASSDSPTAKFVRVDCSSLGVREAEEELFGQQVRSRDDPLADERPRLDRLGVDAKLRQALGGTLFLKGLADLPSQVQAKLGRVLHDGRVLGLETRASLTVDARLIAAVDPSFQFGFQRGRAPAPLDAYFSVRINLPPLRCRKEDIPALSSWFLGEWCRTTRAAPKRLTEPALMLLSALPWRRNASELRDFLSAVASAVHASEIGFQELLAHIRLESGALAAYRLPLSEARKRFEREYILTVLEQHHGRIGNAAEILGIRRTNLYRKLRQLRVSRNRIRLDTENVQVP
jgi:DNA-binding NtrC family response regulator